MKVFLYNQGFGNKGGITTQIRSYATALVQHGHEVTIGGLGRPWWRPASVNVPGVRYVGGPFLPKRTWFKKWDIGSPERLCARVVRHVRENRYDIVHCLGWNLTDVYIFWAGLATGARNLYTATSTADKYYPPDFEKCGLLLSGVHGPALSIAETIKKRMHLNGPCYVFPISPDRLRKPVNQLPENPYSLGFLGHLDKHKKVDRLIQIWTTVVAQLSQAHLHLFGKGSPQAEASLREQARRLGLEKNITFHGFESDLEKVFSEFSSLIVMTKEGLSLAAVESLCAGRTILLPRDGCFPEVYGECETASFFSSEATDDELAEIIVRTLSRGLDEATRTASHDYYQKNFSPEVVGQKLIECYQDLMNYEPGS